jgi:tryptophan synthase beta subunit
MVKYFQSVISKEAKKQILEQVMSEELRDRRAKGLEGEAAIEHYNAWMAASGMEHLMTK